MDVCVLGEQDAYLLSGGSGIAAWDRFEDMRNRMAHDPHDGSLYQYRRHAAFLRRRGDSMERPKMTPSLMSRPRWTHSELSKLNAPQSIMDADTGEVLWEAGLPWFSVRVGKGYVLQVDGTTTGPVRAVCEACNGTVHESGSAGGQWVDVHFHYSMDCHLVMRTLRAMGVGVRECKGMYGREIVSVMVLLQKNATETAWGRGASSRGTLFPPSSEMVAWSCSFDAQVKRQTWQALTVSVDALTGVCICLEGRAAGRVALPRGVSLFVDPKDCRVCVGDFSCYGTMDGYMKLCGFYRRGHTLAEMQVNFPY